MIAKVVVKSGKPTPNGREMKMQLRMGAEGTGRIYLAISEADIHDAHKRASVADNWRL